MILDAKFGEMNHVLDCDFCITANGNVNHIADKNNPHKVTAEQIGAATSADLKKATRHNLLDNSDFINPVNQRGIASAKNESNWAEKYTIDRWKLSGAKCSLDVLYYGGVTITNEDSENDAIFSQTREHKESSGKFTLAVCTTSNEIIVASGELNAYNDTLVSNLYDWGHISLYFSAYMQTMTAKVIVHNNKSISLKWATLYEGEYTAKTIPEYQPKGYGVELVECMRYFYRYPNKNEVVNTPYGIGTSSGNYRVGMLFRLPVPMRIAPTVVASGRFMVTSSTWTPTADVTNIWCSEKNSDMVVLVVDVASWLTSGETYLLQGNQDSTAHIDFSADL